MAFDLWHVLDRFEAASVAEWALQVAPGVHGNPGAVGDFFGFAGVKSRCPLGYGFAHAYLEAARRTKNPAAWRWLLDHFYLGCRVVPLAMRDNGRPPGEVAAPGGPNLDQYDPYIEKDSDLLRHTNPSALIRLACEPEILDMEPKARELLAPAVFGYTGPNGRVPGLGDWLIGAFAGNPARMQAQRTRMHYPISTAVALYKFTGDARWISGASWLVHYAYQGSAREAEGTDGRVFRTWDRGRPSDPEHGLPIPDGDHYLHTWVWYDSLMCQSLLELYLQDCCSAETRSLIEHIVVSLTDWYLFRTVAPWAELGAAGDLVIHNSPLHGGFYDTADSYWLTDANADHRMTWENLVEFEDEEPYYPLCFQRYHVSDGIHFASRIDGRTRCYYSRRNCGNPAPLGPLLEMAAPNFAAADMLEIRAMLEESKGHRDLARVAHHLALQILHDTVLYFNQRYLADRQGGWLLKHRGQSHLVRHVDFSVWNTSEGNHRTPYWLLNGQRVLRMRRVLDREATA